jgi:Predicted permeases
MGLPLKIRFRRSGLYISLIPPYIIGFFVGIFSSIMGVGGGFIIIPAMIYILRMPTNVVVGTSLYQIIFITSFVTILHASTNQSVDIILALILLLGGAIGAQIGVRLSSKLNGAWLRITLAILVLAVGLIMASELIIKPENVIKIISGSNL